jgi:hypothetical protein
MTTPTENEVRMAAVRTELADQEREQLGAAIRACGPYKTAYAKHVQKDLLGLFPDREFYCCRDDSHAGWYPMPPDEDEKIEGGIFRWATYFCFIGKPGKTYRPKTAEQLAQARVQRQEKEVEKMAEEMPLFADAVRAGEMPVKTKNRLNWERRQ